MTEGELLPCPFCGSDYVRLHADCVVQCVCCSSEGPVYDAGDDDGEGAVRLWNTRTPTATPSDVGWQPIETFDYEAERKRQGTMFVWATVTDGTQVVPATHWGVDGLDAGWHDERHQDYDGPEKLDFAPTHWMPLPEPPSS
jgi:hypothetical protein